MQDPEVSAVGITRSDAPTARHDFRLLWTGQSLSLVGDQFMTVALPLLALTTLGASPAQAALLPFALKLPFVLFGLPAGAIVDRIRRRPTMMLCDGVQAAVYLTIALLVALGSLSFWPLLVLVFFAGCATVFFQVAYTSYLPALFVETRALHRGNTRLQLSESVSRSLGPILAGPLIAAAGAVSALFINTATFVASVLTLSKIDHQEDRPLAVARRKGWLVQEVREGLRFVFRHPLLEPALSCGTVYVTFQGMVMAILVLYCADVLGLSPGAVGLVLGVAALGYPTGNLLSASLANRLGLTRALVLGAVVSVTGFVLIALSGNLRVVAGVVAGSIVHGIGEGMFGPSWLTLRQTVTPSGLLGRVNSVERFLLWGAVPLGSVLAATCISIAGLSTALWVGALGTALCLPPLFRRGIRQDVLGRRSAAAEPSAAL